MTDLKDRFKNVILCEDVRDEVGNKKSLMGVFSGDIIASELPATLQLAIFIQYVIEPRDKKEVIHLGLWQDEEKIVDVKMEIDAKQEVSSLIVPKAMVQFNKECAFRITASVDGGETTEILNKKIRKGQVQPR
jgi:uncharacterized protein DUF6941